MEVRLIHNTSRAYGLFRGGLLDVTGRTHIAWRRAIYPRSLLVHGRESSCETSRASSRPIEYPETASARLSFSVHNFRFVRCPNHEAPKAFGLAGVLPCCGHAFWDLGGADEFTDLLYIYRLTPSPQLPSGISMTATWVPWYDILLFFLRVRLTKIWELGKDTIAIRTAPSWMGLFVANVSITS